MKKADLTKLASTNGIELSPAMKRDEIIELIVKQKHGPVLPLVEPRQPGDRAEFEKLTAQGEPAINDSQTKPTGSGRGGARFGAGRKPGVTLEQSRIDNLPTSANRTIIYCVKFATVMLGMAFKNDDLALSDEEANRFGLTATRWMEFHGWKIPQGAAVDIEMAGVTAEIFAPRVVMIGMISKQKKQEAKKDGPTDKTPGETNSNLRQDRKRQDSVGPQSVPAS